LDPAISCDYVAGATLGTFMLMLYRYGRSKPATAVRLGRVTTLRQLMPFVFVLTQALSALVAVPCRRGGGAGCASPYRGAGGRCGTFATAGRLAQRAAFYGCRP